MNRLLRGAKEVARLAWFALNRSAFRDKNTNRAPRLLVDVSVIMRHDAGTGIQRVVRSVWLALSRLPDTGYEVIPVHASRTHGYCFADRNFHLAGTRRGKTPVGARSGDRFLALDLAAHYLPGCAEQLEAWRSAGATTHFVVYDLLPLDQPQWFNPQSRAHFARWFETLIDHADQLLCISDDVQQRVRERLQASARRVAPAVGRLRLSGDIAHSRPSTGIGPAAAAVLKGMIERPALLMVGTVEPRKAHEAALDAMELLWSRHPVTAPDLVIVGKPGWRTEQVQDRIRAHPELGRRLHWLEDASDEALALMYERSRGLLFPSRGEGFGLPLAEAALYRRWALARDLPVVRELGLRNLLLFQDDSPSALAGRIEDLMAEAERGAPEPSSTPTWDWCARELLDQIKPCAQPADRPRGQLLQTS